eukprot:GGOE01051610.1.p1 GENE.GGOE01051610.1~~GGOE01051610.1.p1  ORF type:complete len:294 (+),score=65.69 GGOE01051610.1:60-941(+)
MPIFFHHVNQLYCLAAVAAEHLWVEWLERTDGVVLSAHSAFRLPLPSVGLLRSTSIVRGEGAAQHVFIILMQAYRVEGFRLYPSGEVMSDGVFLPQQYVTCVDITCDTVYFGSREGIVLMVDHEFPTSLWKSNLTCCLPRIPAPTPVPGSGWMARTGPPRIMPPIPEPPAPVPIRAIRAMEHPHPDSIPLMVALLYEDGRFLVSVGNGFSCLLWAPPSMRGPFTAVEWVFWQNDAFLVLLSSDLKNPVWRVKVAHRGQEPQLQGPGAMALKDNDIHSSVGTKRVSPRGAACGC